MVDTTLVENIFEDFDQQDFANSQEYFDYLKRQAEGYKAFKSSPEQVQQDRGAALDALKFLPNVAAGSGNVLLDIAELPLDVYNMFQQEEDDKITLPRFPKFDYTNEELGYVDTAASLLVGGPLSFIKGLNLLASKSPKAYSALRQAYPYSVGQVHDSIRQKGIGFLKDLMPKPEVSEKIARNLIIATGAGLGATTGEPSRDEVIEEVDDVITIQPSDLEADSPPNIRGKEYFERQPEVVDRKAMGGEPGLATDIFEESDVVTDGPEEVQMANLFGRVPIWAVGKVDKAKTLTQDFSKAAKQALDSIKNKLGTKEEVLGDTVEDIDIIDTPAGDTVVGAVKSKKTITDSPEVNESVFYSELEARLMDPNTPKQFSTADQFLNFLQKKQISKAEIDDNILSRYVELSKKNNYPLVKEDMLDIIRQAPMRKIDSVTYGDARYGGTKTAKYDSYQERGALPGTYREDVLFLPAKDIPLDPDSLPGSAHDFDERYVIGWSRLTDRKATLPVDTTKKGIEETIDPAMIKTLKRNQKKLQNQLKGLEASAYEKIRRAVDPDLTPSDEMSARMITESVNSRITALENIDMPLATQIRQFRSKIQDDAVKLEDMEAATQGAKVTITFADEIQSDILQQAKRMEERFKEQLGDLMDKNIDYVKETIRASQQSYRGDYRDINPEVAEYFIKNKSVFRPIFQSETEMQQFMNEYAKTQIVLEDLAKAGLRPDKQLVTKAREARTKQQELLRDLETALSKESLSKLFPNVPFKNRMEWGSALIKRDLAKAAQLLYQDKVPDAAQWYVVSPGKFIKNRYGQRGGTNTPYAERSGRDLKGIGTEEFYGGPDSVDPNGKHYTSTVEKILKRAAKENNSEFKIIDVDNVGPSFAVKITPEMLLPHKTHRKKGGMVYTPEIIDIFEAA